MLRVVVAVALAAALLGVSIPVIQEARLNHADARVATEIDGLVATAERLHERNDPAPPGVSGARRTVRLHLPGPSWSSARLDFLSVPETSDRGEGGTVRWRVDGGREVRRGVSTPLVGPEGGLILRGGGSRTLVLELTRRGGEVVVLVRRPEFKSDGATIPGHDVAGNGTRRPAPG